MMPYVHSTAKEERKILHIWWHEYLASYERYRFLLSFPFMSFVWSGKESKSQRFQKREIRSFETLSLYYHSIIVVFWNLGIWKCILLSCKTPCAEKDEGIKFWYSLICKLLPYQLFFEIVFLFKNKVN
jgi:hypothetical protein